MATFPVPSDLLIWNFKIKKNEIKLALGGERKERGEWRRGRSEGRERGKDVLSLYTRGLGYRFIFEIR